ncbi:MAG: hypothetical protein ACR2JF_13585 [Iamia sp.]
MEPDRASATPTGTAGPRRVTTDANDPLAGIRTLTDVCEEVTFDVDGTVGSFGYSLGQEVDVGDDSLTLVIDFSISQPVQSTVQLEDVLWVRSGILSQVSVSTGAGEETVSDEDRTLLEELVGVADERLVEVIDEDG